MHHMLGDESERAPVADATRASEALSNTREPAAATLFVPKRLSAAAPLAKRFLAELSTMLLVPWSETRSDAAEASVGAASMMLLPPMRLVRSEPLASRSRLASEMLLAPATEMKSAAVSCCEPSEAIATREGL